MIHNSGFELDHGLFWLDKWIVWTNFSCNQSERRCDAVSDPVVRLVWCQSKLETNHLVSLTQPWLLSVRPSVTAGRGPWLIRPITAALRCRWAQWRRTGGSRAKHSVLSPSQTGSQTSHSSPFSVLYHTGLCRSTEWVFDVINNNKRRVWNQSEWMKFRGSAKWKEPRMSE